LISRSLFNKGFSLIELLVVVAIIGILAAVGIVSYVGYVAGAQKTDAQNNMQAMYMVQEEYKSSNALNTYYTTNAGSSCTPNLSNHNTINTNLFGGKEQIDISDPKFVFCIANGASGDGGFKIYSQRPDGSDQMTINANNAKSGW
tara:strand:- start:732 stop:1166 length:435 start_codon:yes stop_codon:yes gene_type:complete